MIIYFWNNWTATSTAEGWQQVDCQFCGRHFEFAVQCEGVGEAHSPFFLTDEKSKNLAVRRAERDAKSRLAREPAPMPCPGCGSYQPAMIRVVKRYHFPLFFKPWWLGDRLEILAALSGLFGVPLLIGSVFFGTDPVQRGMACFLVAPFLVIYSIRLAVFVAQSIRRAAFDPHKGSTAEERMAYAEQVTVPRKPMATPLLSPVFEDEPEQQRRATPITMPIFED